MIIRERVYTKDDGKKELLIEFDVHKATIFHRYIPLTHERCAALRVAKAKEAVIEEFLNSIQGQKYTKRDVLKAYAKTDSYFKDLYKQLYPHGGSRSGAGRACGTTKNTGKTEQLTKALTLEEKVFLERKLQEFREDKLRQELAPYLKQIDEMFGDDEEGREKWRKRMGSMNPALYPQLLERFKYQGVEGMIPVGLKKKKK